MFAYPDEGILETLPNLECNKLYYFNTRADIIIIHDMLKGAVDRRGSRRPRRVIASFLINPFVSYLMNSLSYTGCKWG